MTKKQETISRKNKDKTRKALGIYGKRNLVLHHINPEWKHNDIERYIQWNIEDVVVMDRGEHTRLHLSGRIKTPEQIEKQRSSMKGKTPWNKGKKMSDEAKANMSASQKGKKLSDETKKKIGEASKQKHNNLGRHYYTNGIINKMAFECPEGFWLGYTRRKKK